MAYITKTEASIINIYGYKWSPPHLYTDTAFLAYFINVKDWEKKWVQKDVNVVLCCPTEHQQESMEQSIICI